MIGDKVLLDTNIALALLNGDREVQKRLEEAQAVYLPIIVIGELYFGAEYSIRLKHNFASLKKISVRFKQLLITEETCLHYGKLKAHLRKVGKPIPENDIWIAALAIQHKLTFLSRDSHFKELPGVRLRSV
jgi:tRNA(fMet)-specific endonuclease VapC